jgi:hypothetical protein
MAEPLRDASEFVQIQALAAPRLGQCLEGEVQAMVFLKRKQSATVRGRL